MTEQYTAAAQSPVDPPRRSSRPSIPVIAAGTLVVGIVTGYFVGRWSLARQWDEPRVQITPDEYARSSSGNADPTPKAGTRILRPMPLAKSREVMAALTANDPVKAIVATIGRGEGGSAELHVVLRNTGRCEVSRVAGIFYAFDAYYRPSKINLHGEHYVSFSAPLPGDNEPLKIAPGAKKQISQATNHVENASLAVVQVDEVTCADGSTWTRPAS